MTVILFANISCLLIAGNNSTPRQPVRGSDLDYDSHMYMRIGQMTDYEWRVHQVLSHYMRIGQMTDYEWRVHQVLSHYMRIGQMTDYEWRVHQVLSHYMRIGQMTDYESGINAFH